VSLRDQPSGRAIRPDHRRGWTVGHDPTGTELDNAVPATPDELDVVRRNHDGRAGLAALLEQLDDALRVAAVEVGRRLVGKQHYRPSDKGPGDRDPTLLAAGELVWVGA
jgi:hypothetical protein